MPGPFAAGTCGLRGSLSNLAVAKEGWASHRCPLGCTTSHGQDTKGRPPTDASESAEGPRSARTNSIGASKQPTAPRPRSRCRVRSDGPGGATSREGAASVGRQAIGPLAGRPSARSACSIGCAHGRPLRRGTAGTSSWDIGPLVCGSGNRLGELVPRENDPRLIPAVPLWQGA